MRVHIPYERFEFKDKITRWELSAHLAGRTFRVSWREANWKVRRLFFCEHCREHCLETGRKKARCPGCRKLMTEHANYVVPYER